jgi:hypothetical protein
VPLKVYDETISTLQTAVNKAKMGESEKKEAIRKLNEIATRAENNFKPNTQFENLVEKERAESWKYEGRTVFGKVRKPTNVQLKLF